MGFREVKSELVKLEKDALIKHISELYKNYKGVKEYFDLIISPDESKILEQYKDKVTEGFFPKRGFQLKLSTSKKAISDFKKLGISQQSEAELLLHFVENGVEFVNAYGDIDENFYTSLVNNFENALGLLAKNGLLDKYQEKALKIVNETSDMGWGVHDYLFELFHNYYE